MSSAQCLKTLLVKGDDDTVVALLLCGHHSLNDIKAEKLDGVASPLTMASDAEISQAAGCDAGYIGPIDLDVPMIVDRSAATLALKIFVKSSKGMLAQMDKAPWLLLAALRLGIFFS